MEVKVTDEKRKEEAARRLIIFLCGGDEEEAEQFAQLLIRDATEQEQQELLKMYRIGDAEAEAEARRRGYVPKVREPLGDPKPLTDEELTEFKAFMEKVYARLEKEE